MNEKFWRVIRDPGGAGEQTEKQAIELAEQRAKEHPGETYIVLEATHLRRFGDMVRVDLREGDKQETVNAEPYADEMVLVPRDPTEEQVREAVHNVNRKYNHNPVDELMVRQVWSTMLWARPEIKGA